jgi:hypothetical protein
VVLDLIAQAILAETLTIARDVEGSPENDINRLELVFSRD